MVGFIVFWVIILILAIIFLPFLKALMQDQIDLKTPLEEKFKVTISLINQGLLMGTGEVVRTESKKQINLFSESEANKLIHFLYGTGHLTIILKFKWYHKEMVFEKTFYHMSNASTFDQKEIANAFLEEARVKMEAHMSNSMGNVGDIGKETNIPLEDDPMNVVFDVYDELSISQKQAMVCFMYIIARADGASESSILNTAAFKQHLQYMRQPWDECKKMLSSYGESYIFQQLQGLDDGMATMLISSCIPLVLGDPIMGPNMKRMEKFYACFNAIGYNQEKVDHNIEKAAKFMEMFSH